MPELNPEPSGVFYYGLEKGFEPAKSPGAFMLHLASRFVNGVQQYSSEHPVTSDQIIDNWDQEGLCW